MRSFPPACLAGRDQSNLFTAPGVGDDQNPSESIHTHRYKTVFFVGRLVLHRQSALVFEDYNGVRKFNPVLPKVIAPLLLIPFEKTQLFTLYARLYVHGKVRPTRRCSGRRPASSYSQLARWLWRVVAGERQHTLGGMGRIKMAKTRIPPDLQVWIDARKRYHLSHAQIQMARELGMNPKKFGGLANHRQEPWKAPLPNFIEDLYERRFGKLAPDRVISIEERAKEIAAKKAARRDARAKARREREGEK